MGGPFPALPLFLTAPSSTFHTPPAAIALCPKTIRVGFGGHFLVPPSQAVCPSLRLSVCPSLPLPP